MDTIMAIVAFLTLNVLLVVCMYKKSFIGTIHISTTDVNKDVYKLEVIDFYKMHKRRFVIFKINNTDPRK